MARVICIAGESGSGKTTSMRNLNPEETYYVDCDKKGLSWRGWKKQYNTEKKNYFACDDPKTVLAVLYGIAEKRPEIKNIIIDTISAIMIADEMRRMQEKGYDKWKDLAQCIWEIVDAAYPLREDLNIIFVAHTQTDREDDGYRFTRIRTSGRKLDKIHIEDKFSIVLIAKCINGEHVFETHANSSIGKSPMGLFEEDTIPNDITAVIEALKEYENE